MADTMNIYPSDTSLGGAQPTSVSDAPAGSDQAAIPGSGQVPDTGGVPGASAGSGATPAPLPVSTPPQGTAALQQPAIPVVNAAQFADVATNPWPMGSAANAGLALARPSTKRILLSIRNSKSSAGTLFIGFGQGASDIQSPMSIDPGGILLFDTVVPQDDIYLAASAYPTNAVIGYSNKPL